MQQSGEQKINAPRERVWEALNDPDVLRECIPGCQSMEADGDGGFEASVKAKVGPVSATFKGAVSLEDVDPPNSYTLVGSGKGGAAGFARGEARVRLESLEAEGTLLTWELEARVGGRLAQIGARLVDGATRKMADEFFGNFRQQVAGDSEADGESEAESGSSAQPVVTAETAESSDGATETPPSTAVGSPLMWMAAAAGVLAVLIAMGWGA